MKVESALGDGSEENPYQIDTLANLKWLSFTESVWGEVLYSDE